MLDKPIVEKMEKMEKSLLFWLTYFQCLLLPGSFCSSGAETADTQAFLQTLWKKAHTAVTTVSRACKAKNSGNSRVTYSCNICVPIAVPEEQVLW
jgi:hypothetical protein